MVSEGSVQANLTYDLIYKRYVLFIVFEALNKYRCKQVQAGSNEFYIDYAIFIISSRVLFQIIEGEGKPYARVYSVSAPSATPAISLFSIHTEDSS